MIKYVDTQVVFREFPDEVTLAINLSLCQNNCIGCHSSYLSQNIGDELTNDALDFLINKNTGITCVGFMGGDNDPISLLELIKHVKESTNLNVGWYSGKDEINKDILSSNLCDYIKIGHYDKKCGPLDKETTNQKLYFLSDTGYKDITYMFWNNKKY